MWLAIVALVFGILAFVFTVFVFAYSIHLARMWLAGGSMDKTAEKDDITKLDIHINNKLDVLITEVKGIRNDLKEVCKYDKPKSDKPDEPKP